MNDLYFVTGNQGKFSEVQSFMRDNNPEVMLHHINIDIEEIQTLDHEAVVLDKARKAFNILKKPLLIDDAGLYFNAYHRFPGTLTKFVYQGIGIEGILKLTAHDHRAYYLVYMAFIDAENSVQLFQERCDGKIIAPREPIINSSLPFDAIFVPNGSEKTYGELKTNPREEFKDCRIKTLEKFINWYKTSAH